MKIKIFQLDEKKKTQHLMFTPYELLEKYQGTKDINSALYKEVFSGDVECKDLEEVFTEFNKPQPMLRGHSLSVSDIVTTENGAFFCDRVGFKKVDFDESQATKQKDLLRVIYVEPGKKAYVTEMAKGLEPIQRTVQGHYEHVYIGKDKAVILCNEEGKLKGMQGNRRYNNGENVIAGPFVVVGLGRDDYVSLTDEQVEKYMQEFGDPEEISEEETQAGAKMTFIAFK